MAIQHRVELDCGITLEHAYLRIENFAGDKETVKVAVGLYRDAEAAKRGPDTQPAHRPVQVLEFAFPTPQQNFIVELYKSLHAIPAMAGAVEV